MTIGIDGTPLRGPVGGIRRFTAELTAALRGEFPQDNYVLLSDQFAPPRWPWERYWWLIGLNQTLRRQCVNVFHGTDFAVPYWSGVPSVLTLHDLSPWRDPQPASARVRRRTGMLLRLGIPRMVHTPSEAVRQEAMEYFRLPEAKVMAIPLAASGQFQPQRRDQDGIPYFLYLGTLEERKNLSVIVSAAKLLWEEGLDFELHLAGRAREAYALPAHPRLRLLGQQQEAALAPLYSNSVASLYPSRYEGFGLPVLEAMQCGAAVIASDIAVLREVGGSAAVYAPPHDAPAWAEAMRGLLLDRQWRESRQAACLQRATAFGWRQTARQFRRLYEQCAQ
jgi:glycosyltransferase involved in cell wall biosynthesis